MNYPPYFDEKKSLNLFGLKKNFDFLSSLYIKKKLPKVLLFSGKKGSGKSTMLNHFLFSIFDEKNYDKENNIIKSDSIVFKQFNEGIFSNIIYLNGSDYKSVKIDDIRALKDKIFQTSISNKNRFIIFDDIDLFNNNSLNALLKVIEEPGNQNYFLLINNNSKPLLKTIRSRALEIKIILNENTRIKTINSLMTLFKLERYLDPLSSDLSPGNFIKFNHICLTHNILLENDFIDNFSIILNLYKKNKDILFINFIFFIVDYYFKTLRKMNKFNYDQYEIKNFILENLNNFFMYNINQNSLINAVNDRLNNE